MLPDRTPEYAFRFVVIGNASIRFRQPKFGPQIVRRDAQRLSIRGDRIRQSPGFVESGAQFQAQRDVRRRHGDRLLEDLNGGVPIGAHHRGMTLLLQILHAARRASLRQSGGPRSSPRHEREHEHGHEYQHESYTSRARNRPAPCTRSRMQIMSHNRPRDCGKRAGRMPAVRKEWLNRKPEFHERVSEPMEAQIHPRNYNICN